MPTARQARRVALSVAASLLLAGCSVTTHQPVQLTLRGDGLPQNAQGRRMAAAQRGALERRVTASVDCERQEPCNAPPDECQSQCVTIAPIASRLGPPPRPGDFARRIGTTRSAGSRDDARAAYADAVRERYRSYGVYISQQLAGADWVEIAGPYEAPARRYRGRQVYGGIDEALVAMGDRYASLEWDRCERERSKWTRDALATRSLAARCAVSSASSMSDAPTTCWIACPLSVVMRDRTTSSVRRAR